MLEKLGIRKTTMISIADYIQEMSQKGIAKPNRYWVQFTLPKGIDASIWGNRSINQEATIGAIQAADTRLNSGYQLSIKCVQAQFPGRNLFTYQNRHWGAPYKLPYSADYTDATFVFVGSRDLRERLFFELWQETVVNVNLNSINFYEEYVSQITMYQLDNQNRMTYGVILDEAYPVAVAPLDHSYAQNNETVPISVSLSYRRWRNTSFFNIGRIR